MKLRQKLAVVLASAMAVTAVPVVTMAASTNSLSKETLKVKKECEFTKISTANALKIKFDRAANDGDEIFYLKLDNAEWNEDTLKSAAEVNKDTMTYDADAKTGTITVGKDAEENDLKINFRRQSDEILEITIPEAVANYYDSKDTAIAIPILAKAKDGDAKIEIDKDHIKGTITGGSSFVFATSADKTFGVTVGDAKTFYTSGEIAEITIDEVYEDALSKADAKNRTITIELDDTDFYFVGGEATLEGKYGFSGETKVTVNVDKDDDGKATIELPATTSTSGRGQYILKGVKVKSTNKSPEEGDFLVDIKGDGLSAEKTDAKVAVISKYGVYVKMKNDKAEDVKAGRTEEVEFEIGESVEDSMITGREFEMTLENGHWDYKQLVKDAKSAGKLGEVKDVTYSEKMSDDDFKDYAKTIDEKWLAKQLLDNDGDWEDDGDVCEAEFDVDSDGDIIPETIIFTIGKDNDGKAVQSNDECDKLKVKTKICVPVDNKEKEKVTLKVSGRGLENEASTTAINIINPFNVTFEQAVLKTGLQGQVSGSVTLTETDKDMFQKGDITFKIKKDDEDFGIYLKDVTVEVSDGLKGTKSDITKGKAKDNAKIELTLNRVSKTAATITFKDMTFTTDRTVPEGTYDLEIGGTGIDADGHTLTIKDFVKISTANTEEITTSGLAKGTAKFVIGESKYVLNDKEVTMDAPSYIQDPGYTMVPVRYVANAFGVSDANILFGKGTVTIFAGERTISLTTGSNIAVVNGNSVAMATKVVNKDGRTYVPAGQIASLLGIKSTWDSATKTATFENN